MRADATIRNSDVQREHSSMLARGHTLARKDALGGVLRNLELLRQFAGLQYECSRLAGVDTLVAHGAGRPSKSMADPSALQRAPPTTLVSIACLILRCSRSGHWHLRAATPVNVCVPCGPARGSKLDGFGQSRTAQIGARSMRRAVRGDRVGPFTYVVCSRKRSRMVTIRTRAQ